MRHTKSFMLYITPRDHRRLQVLACARQTSMSEIVRALLATALDDADAAITRMVRADTTDAAADFPIVTDPAMQEDRP